jgi:WD40 repeat protein
VLCRAEIREPDSGKLREETSLWDAATRAKVRTFERRDSQTLLPLDFIAFAPDGRRMLTMVSGNTSLWQVETGKKLHTFAGRAVFGPDGRLLLTSEGKTAALLDSQTLRPLRRFQAHLGVVASLTPSPGRGDAVLLAAHGWPVRWDAPSGPKSLAPPGLVSAARSLRFSPTGRYAVAQREDNRLVAWDVTTGQPLRALDIDQGSAKARVWRFDRATGESTEVLMSRSQCVHMTAISPDGRRVLTGSYLPLEGSLRPGQPKPQRFEVILWDLKTGKGTSLKYRKPLGGGNGPFDACSAEFSADGRQVAVGLVYQDGGPETPQTTEVVLYDATTGERRTVLDREQRGRCLTLAPGGRLLLTGGRDVTARLWDAEGNPLRNFKGSAPLLSAAFSPDGRLIVAGLSDDSAVLWETATARVLHTFKGHGAAIGSVAFRGDGRQVWTGSEDGTSRVWDVATGEELARLLSLSGGQDWAVVTPEGLFDGSRKGREQVAFRIGNGLDVVPLDRFFQDFYYPGLLDEIGRGGRPMPGKVFQSDPAPSLRMLVNQGGGARPAEAVIDVAVTDQGGGIKGPWLQHNGATLRIGSKLRQEGRTVHYRFPVTLMPGDNRFEVRAATADGSRESDPASHTLAFNGQLPEPQLHVIAIGINRYAQGSGVSHLDCCLSDAKAVANLFRKSTGTLYQQVHVTQLFDDQATRDGILKAVTATATKARAQDTLVLYVASHGIALGQRFYLIPHDFQPAKGEAAPAAPQPQLMLVATRGYRSTSDAREAAVRTRGLAIDELGEALAAVPALKRVLIFDTCHSGSAIALAGKKQNPFAFRGAMERFSRAQGVYSLAATAADELAAETKELGHSILTYALLAGLKAVEHGPLQGQALRAGSRGAVDVLAWFRYARDHVPRLYEQYVGRPQQVELSGEDQPSFPLLRLETK